MDKDYYKILGVQESDSADNIKIAYRKLARKWHPDIAGNSEEVILKFKEINEAYATLSNPSKRAEYDRARRFYNYAKTGSASYTEKKHDTEKKTYTTKPQNKGFNFNWEDFISKKSKMNSQKKENKIPRKGENIYAEVEITMLEAIDGAEKIINVLQSGVCPKCGGRKFVNGSLCTFCAGKGEINQHKKFTVKIPAGIRNGAKIRLAGEGGDGVNGGQNGDLYITVLVKDCSDYKIEDLNIIKTVAIAPYEAVLGTTVEIKSITGAYSVKIPPLTQNGQKIRLSKCGLVQNDKIGDMIIVVEITIPQKLTEEEIEMYKKLSELSSSSDIRDNIHDR